MTDTCYPETMFFLPKENRLIELSAAYADGYVSDEEMKQLADNGQACVFYTGDVDRNRTVSINDVTEIQILLTSNVVGDVAPYWLGDVDGNGHLDINDATIIQKYLAGYFTEF